MTSQIYRYKFSDEFLNEMLHFVEVHRFDTIPVFNEEWKTWVDSHHSLICRENRRLQNIGYDEDVLHKMYKSARYYFKNKEMIEKAPKKRRSYIRIDKSVLLLMDAHIEEMQAGKPSLLYNDFNEKNKNILNTLKNQLLQHGLDQEDIALKLKKTYKNRHYKFITK